MLVLGIVRNCERLKIGVKAVDSGVICLMLNMVWCAPNPGERGMRAIYFASVMIFLCGAAANIYAQSATPSQDAAAKPAQDSAAAAPAPTSAENPVHRAKLKSGMTPTYPAGANVSGTVVLKYTITKDGTVDDVQFVSGPEELKDAAIAAVKQWIYEPATYSGHPIPMPATTSLTFKLPPLVDEEADLPNATNAAKATASASGTTFPPEAASAPIVGVRVQMAPKDVAKLLVRQVAPHYPDSAKRNHVQGSVKMHAIIGIDGVVKELTVISGPAELRDSAKDAVQQWRYKQVMIKGTPTEVDTTITVIFTMG
jgi:TonB family protein